MRVPRTSLFFFTIPVLLIAITLTARAETLYPLALSASGSTSTEGFLTFSWRSTSRVEPATLRISSEPAFQHPERDYPLNQQILQKAQIHVSGFEDGHYFARLVSLDGMALSATVAFEVKHRNLTAALLVFAVGAALFLGLVLVLVRFNRRGGSDD